MSARKCNHHTLPANKEVVLYKFHKNLFFSISYGNKKAKVHIYHPEITLHFHLTHSNEKVKQFYLKSS